MDLCGILGFPKGIKTKFRRILTFRIATTTKTLKTIFQFRIFVEIQSSESIAFLGIGLMEVQS